MPEELQLIAEYQQAIKAAGYQWKEHIYNDGSENDCSVHFTLNQNPSAERSEYTGWGRFPRVVCWAAAYERLVLGIKRKRAFEHVDKLRADAWAGLWSAFPHPVN